MPGQPTPTYPCAAPVKKVQLNKHSTSMYGTNIDIL